jgi:hypothetical protein
MAEKCPDCGSITLSYDPRNKTARCYKRICSFEKYVENKTNYFNEYVFTKSNWSNYCNSTPTFVREIRGHTRQPER